jgi:hypothetical protein
MLASPAGMKKHLVQFCFALVTSAAVAAPAIADNAAPPAAAAEKMWSKINVQSVKPTLSARNVYVIKGEHVNGVTGGWTLETSYAINKDTKVVQITLAAHAPKGSVTNRNLEKMEAKVDIKELVGPAYSGAKGKYDVVVADRTGKELARTVYEIK